MALEGPYTKLFVVFRGGQGILVHQMPQMPVLYSSSALFSGYPSPPVSLPSVASHLPDAFSRVCPGPVKHPEVVALTSVTICCHSCPTVVMTLIVVQIMCTCS